MVVTSKRRRSSQAWFVGGILLAAILLAFGSSMFLFSVTTPYLTSGTDRVLAILVSLAFLSGGAATGYRTLR